MALVTIQRSPSVSSSPPSSEYGGSVYSFEEEVDSVKSLSEYYFAVKGFAVLLPKKECQQVRHRRSSVPPTDIQSHLQAMLHLLRPGDTLQMAVRLESLHLGRIRYLVVITVLVGENEVEESCILGIDFPNKLCPTLGLVLPILADANISLDGDGGFSVCSGGRKHIFKPISVQAMWSALQTIHKERNRASDLHVYAGVLTHRLVEIYDKNISSDQSCINEWNAMEGLESRRPPSPDSFSDKEKTELLIRKKLKEIMMNVDIDEVTSKYIRQRLEDHLQMDLFQYKYFIDQEMLIILGQMDSATQIFPHVYLGSEWNASNLEELRSNGVGFILNVTKEIDNFFPGQFEYLNIRVCDNENTDFLKYWDDTYKYINYAKSKSSKVLVHCKMGISRSASVVIAYAMKAFHFSLEEGLQFVRSKRSCVNPNQAFCSQLKIYQGILEASRQRHNALFRSKSETNLKSFCQRGQSDASSPDTPPPPPLSLSPRRESKWSTTNRRLRSSSTLLSVYPSGPPLNIKPEQRDSETTVTSTDIDSEGFTEVKFFVPPYLRCSSPRRPRSLSPEKELTRPYCSLGERKDSAKESALDRIKSLCGQTWNAHVTLYECTLPKYNQAVGDLERRDCFLNIWNSLYSHSADKQIRHLYIPSLVKDRISEFEMAKQHPSFKWADDYSRSLPNRQLLYEYDGTTKATDEDYCSQENNFYDVRENALVYDEPTDTETIRNNSHKIPIKSQFPIGINSLNNFQLFLRGCKENNQINTKFKRSLSVGKYDYSENMKNKGDLNMKKLTKFKSETYPVHNLEQHTRDYSVLDEPNVLNEAVNKEGEIIEFFSNNQNDYSADSLNENINRPSLKKSITGMQSESNEKNLVCFSDEPTNTSYLICSLSTKNEGKEQNDPGYFINEIKFSPQKPEHEIPLPGTVRLQMKKLERCVKKIGENIPCSSSPPTIGRSYSSGCVNSSQTMHSEKGNFGRSFSEKRTKSNFKIDGAKGFEIENDKEINEDLNKFFALKRTSQSLKQRCRRWKRPSEYFPRSHSLEELEKNSHVCQSIKSSDTRDIVKSSQDLLNRLVERSEAQILELERDQDEINVKDLVGLFEETKEKKVSPRKDRMRQDNDLNDRSDLVPSLSNLKSIGEPETKRDLRPKSENMSNEKKLPPVPIRKSSLEYDFRPVSKSSTKVTSTAASDSVPTRSGNNRTPVNKMDFKNQSKFNTISHDFTRSNTSVTPPHTSKEAWKLPHFMKRPTPQGNWSACSLDIRRRKEQGKTHPLSKLVIRKDSLL